MEKKVKCPNCGKAVSWEGNPYRPFCCEECKMADLHKWLTQEYLVVEELPFGGQVGEEDNPRP